MMNYITTYTICLYFILLDQQMHIQHTQSYNFYKPYDIFQWFSNTLRELMYQGL